MKATIEHQTLGTLEIEFIVNPGYADTRDQPGEPVHIEEIIILSPEGLDFDTLPDNDRDLIEAALWMVAESNDCDPWEGMTEDDFADIDTLMLRSFDTIHDDNLFDALEDL